MKSIGQSSRFQDQGLSLTRKNPKLNHNKETALLDPLIDGFGCLVVSMLVSGSRVRGFDPDRKNPQHAFLRKGSKIICPISQLWGMSKIPASAVNYGMLAKLSSVSFPR
jgi:hypothetical protein